MISFSFKVFLVLNVGVSFHVDGAKEIVRAGYKATLICSVSYIQVNEDNSFHID